LKTSSSIACRSAAALCLSPSMPSVVTAFPFPLSGGQSFDDRVAETVPKSEADRLWLAVSDELASHRTTGGVLGGPIDFDTIDAFLCRCISLSIGAVSAIWD
jgi:hypothetical protein